MTWIETRICDLCFQEGIFGEWLPGKHSDGLSQVTTAETDDRCGNASGVRASRLLHHSSQLLIPRLELLQQSCPAHSLPLKQTPQAAFFMTMCWLNGWCPASPQGLNGQHIRLARLHPDCLLPYGPSDRANP
jgi:hypothetical protein